jgi:hypothetical protein
VKLIALLMLAMTVCLSAAHAAAPKFTQEPVARKRGVGATIEFAVDRETDVAVFIENAAGKVVKHLVAGVLGPNAPAPLKSNSLSQSIEWDGKADYGRSIELTAGKPGYRGPFKVRVALGLGAKFDKIIARDPQNVDYILCIATGPDGTLYVLSSIGAAVPNWQTDGLVALDREGKYKRTVLPFPANIDKSKLGKLQTVDINGQLSPLVHRIPNRTFYPGPGGAKGMTVTRDGVILRLAGGFYGSGGTTLSALGTDGGVPWGDYRSPNLRLRLNHKPTRICASSDGKWAYVAGVEKSPAVYRIALPERKTVERFFGDAKVTGNDETHLGAAPAGLTVDGKGNLLIADRANNRVVVVSEKDGSFVGSFPTPGPLALAVDQATGHVYLTRVTGKKTSELVRLSGWKDPKVLMSLKLKGGGSLMALDAGAKPPIVWLVSGGLLRVQEVDGKFVAKKVNSHGFGRAAFEDISVDRFRPDKEVYVRTTRRRWVRFNEASGKFTAVNLRGKGNLGKGLCIMPGPDGNIYGPEWPSNLYKWDRNGKEIAWESPEKMSADFIRKGQHKNAPNATFMPVCMTFMSHTLGIRHDGHLFVFSRASNGRPRSPKALYEYLPSGKRVGDPIIWKVSDVAVGPKFDQQGNIYVAEIVKPKGKLFPKDFKDVVARGPKGAKRQGTPTSAVMTMYGSILKFSPKGGMVKYPKIKWRGATNADPFKGEPKLAPGLRSEDVSFYYGTKFQALSSAKVIGAEWIRMGISHIDMFYCNCESTRFDVDEFGRVWYPDLGRFRVVVLDTNGNELTYFGAYGNADSAGPDSSIPKPEIAFAWLIGVGVTEKYAYMGDSLNRRLLRTKLTYAAEATCPIR